MDIRKLQRVIVDGLEGVKGQNIVVFNTEHLSSLFERVIIASGTSNRQTRALASGARCGEGRRLRGPAHRGRGNGEWIIVDCGPAVVHVMQPAIREYYHLEEIWGDKPVRMKFGAAAAALARARRAAGRKPRAAVAGTTTPSRAAPGGRPRRAGRAVGEEGRDAHRRREEAEPQRDGPGRARRQKAARRKA